MHARCHQFYDGWSVNNTCYVYTLHVYCSLITIHHAMDSHVAHHMPCMVHPSRFVLYIYSLMGSWWNYFLMHQSVLSSVIRVDKIRMWMDESLYYAMRYLNREAGRWSRWVGLPCGLLQTFLVLFSGWHPYVTVQMGWAQERSGPVLLLMHFLATVVPRSWQIITRAWKTLVDPGKFLTECLVHLSQLILVWI